MVKSAWYDVEMRGRRLEAVWKRMNTQFYKFLDTHDYDHALAFYDRMLKTEQHIKPYIDQITGVKELIKSGKSVQADILR